MIFLNVFLILNCFLDSGFSVSSKQEETGTEDVCVDFQMFPKSSRTNQKANNEEKQIKIKHFIFVYLFHLSLLLAKNRICPVVVHVFTGSVRTRIGVIINLRFYTLQLFIYLFLDVFSCSKQANRILKWCLLFLFLGHYICTSIVFPVLLTTTTFYTIDTD